MVAQGVHLVLIHPQLVPLAELVDLAGVLVVLLKLEAPAVQVAALVVLVVKVEMHTLLQPCPVVVVVLAAILVLVVLAVVVFVMELLVLAVVLAVVLVDEQCPELVHTPALAVVALAYWVKAQAELEVLFTSAGVVDQAEPLAKTHPVPQMLAHQGVEPMVVMVVVSVVSLTPEVVMAVLVRFALSGPAVLAHSHQLVREIYK